MTEVRRGDSVPSLTLQTAGLRLSQEIRTNLREMTGFTLARPTF